MIEQYFSRMVGIVFFLFQHCWIRYLNDWILCYLPEKGFFYIALSFHHHHGDITHPPPLPRGDWMVVVASVGSMSVSEQLGTYPSSNPTKVNWYQVRFNVGLKEGRGGVGLGAVARILKLISMCWAVKEDVMWSSAKESELISTISWVHILKKKIVTIIAKENLDSHGKLPVGSGWRALDWPA